MTTTPLGVSTGSRLNAGKELDHDLDKLAETGAQFVRWGSRPDPALAMAKKFDPSNLDPIWEGIEQRGMRSLFQVSGWDNNMNAHPAEYAAYTRACVQRYAHFDPVAWELGNETEHVAHWDKTCTPTGYTALLRESYDLSKPLTSSPIILGGLGGQHADWLPNKTCVDYLKGLYDAGARGYFDGVGFHPYTDPEDWLKAIAAGDRGAGLLVLAHALCKSEGDLHMPFFITEFSWPSHAVSDLRKGSAQRVTEAQQAQYLTESIKDMDGRPWIRAISWFDLSDIGVNLDSRGDWMGLYRADWTPKPSLAAFKNLAA